MISGNFYLVKSKQRATLSTQLGATVDTGIVTISRREIGFGKGEKGRLIDGVSDDCCLRGRLKRRYFGIVAYYSGEFAGTVSDARRFYEAIT